MAAVAGAPTEGVVGTTITPGVLVLDQHGNPMADVRVSFAISSGGGSISGSTTTTTGADGVAAVSGWKLGNTVSVNAMTASAPNLTTVSFSVQSTPGAPTVVSKVAGDNGLAQPGGTVPRIPKVRVTDQFNNAISNLAVTFAVASGGGAVTGGSATTNANGEASVGSWTLGASEGTNTLTAQSAGVPAATFTAVACAMSPLAFGASTSGAAIATTDCRLTSGARYSDIHTFTLASQTTIAITMTSSAVNPYLALFDGSNTFIGETVDIEAAAGSALLQAILPAGTYAIAATTASLDQVGAYTLSLGAGAASQTNCDLFWVARGISTSQTLAASDCQLQDGAGGIYYGDIFGVSLESGSVLTVDVSSAAFDTWIDMFTLAGQPVAFNDNGAAGSTNSKLVFNAPAFGYYLLFPNSALPLKTGAYTIAIGAASTSASLASAGAAASLQTKGLVRHQLARARMNPPLFMSKRIFR